MKPTTLHTEAPEWLESALDPTFEVDDNDEEEGARVGTLGYF